MSRDYEQISTDGRQRTGFRMLMAIAIIAFIGGVILTGWLATRYDLFAGDNMLVGANGTDDSATADRLSAQGGVADTAAGDEASGLSIRIADMENRLSRINVQAEAASGNAARAESLLIAFATRRAIEQGRPLGYLDQQLQLRFGASEPDAVRAIREFASDPVVIEQLQSRLETMEEKLRNGGNDGFLDKARREFSELFLVRKQGTPGTASAARLRRAQRLIDAGNVSGAIAEVEKLPGAEVAEKWLSDARRFKDVRDALETLEASAIFEPRMLRDSYGDTIAQPSPLPPVQAEVENTEAEPKQRSNAASASGDAQEDENFFGF